MEPPDASAAGHGDARLWSKITAFFAAAKQRAWRSLRPSQAAWSGAGAGVLGVALLALAAGVVQAQGKPGWLGVLSLIRMLLAALVLPFLGGHLAAWGVDLVKKIPYPYRWKVVAAALVFVIMAGALSKQGLLLVIILAAVSGSLLGAGIGALWKARAALTPLQQGISLTWTALGAGVLAFSLAWYAWPGQQDSRPLHAAQMAGRPVSSINLPDPSQPGPYAVKTMTYGSGDDLWRAEFGQQVNWKSQAVDATRLLNKSLNPASIQLRRWVWGFGFEALPVNGRVWMPDSDEGPFPLVLMVHGNHSFSQFSDPGFAYLGELLASRGFIFVSVDQNFLNGGFTDLFESIKNENDARGWLLLEHARQWAAWNADPANPVFGKVDLNRIAAGGHSRGGEAAAIAAAFNRLPAYPDDGSLRFNYQFNIKAVVAIAPIDGQYRPGGRSISLEDVDYFVLHGSHDADVVSFDGMNQYERVHLGGGNRFKAALYVYRANHGQFNTIWGDSDYTGFVRGLLNRGELLSEAQQQKIAEVYITAFLESSLLGHEGYRPLFQDARAAGQGWLPDTIYINRYDTAKDLLAASFDEDLNMQTLSISGGKITGKNLASWIERRIPTRWGYGENSVVILGWDGTAPAEYALELPVQPLALRQADQLIFALSDAAAGSPNAQNQPLDLTLALEDSYGQQARVALSSRMLAQPPLRAVPWKALLFFQQEASEPVLQSYVFPLADFKISNPALSLNHVRGVRFIFDRTPRGSIILDDIGFRQE